MIQDATEPPPSAPAEAVSALTLARQELLLRANDEVGALFRVLDNEMNTLLKRLGADAKRAEQRRSNLQGEIANDLRSMQSARHDAADHQGDLDGDGWVEDLNGDGMADHENAFEDDEWMVETERWQNETVTMFFMHLDRHLNDTNETKRLDTALDSSSRLFKDLDAGLEHLREDKVTWRDLQDLIHNKAEDLAHAGFPAYEDAEPPEDDEYTYGQLLHVQAYIEDVLWPTRLKSAIPVLEKLRKDFQSGDMNALQVSADLEEMAAKDIIPHYWMHHSADDYYYRDYDY